MLFIFFDSFIKPGLFLFCSCFLAALIICLSLFLSDNKPYAEKVSAYECGFDPDEDARNVFDVRFYIIAMLFLIFDLEAIFFFSLVCFFKLYKFKRLLRNARFYN